MRTWFVPEPISSSLLCQKYKVVHRLKIVKYKVGAVDNVHFIWVSMVNKTSVHLNMTAIEIKLSTNVSLVGFTIVTYRSH